MVVNILSIRVPTFGQIPCILIAFLGIYIKINIISMFLSYYIGNVHLLWKCVVFKQDKVVYSKIR